jgi:RecJ-like exonuclease
VKRKKFTYLCLLLSVIGLVLLQFSTTVLRPEVIPVEDVESEDIGQTVRVEGTVQDFYSTDSATFFTLEDSTGELQIVSFNPVEAGNGREVSVLGNVELRNGELQLVSTRIEQN